MSGYTALDFQRFARKVNCMSDLDFANMYRDVFNIDYPSYVKEKFEQCRLSFLRWMCEMDEESLNKLIEYCLA